MNKSELIDALFSAPEEEVLIEIDNQLQEIAGFGHAAAEFDGFCTVYPACITIKIKEDNGINN